MRDLVYAANSIMQATMNATAYPSGWGYGIMGSLPYYYTNITQYGDLMSCKISCIDPTDMLATLNEIMFRISLEALSSSSNSSLARNYTMPASEMVIFYESRYGYLIAATIISLLACCSVLPMFDGFWRLDRPFSLSPIEIAKAFDAPALRSSGMGTSDLPVDKLVKHVGTTEVQYVAVTGTEQEDSTLRQRKFIVSGVA